MAGRLSIASSRLTTSRAELKHKTSTCKLVQEGPMAHLGCKRTSFNDKKILNKRCKLFQFLLRFISMKSWFVRISWYKKSYYVMDLISITQDFSMILKLMKNIDSGIFKDYTYLKSQDILEGSSDMIPADDNRTVEDVNLLDVKLQDKVWYAKLKPDKQFYVLNGLITIGGYAFKRKIYEQITKLVTQKQQIKNLLSECPSVSHVPQQQIDNFASSDFPVAPDEEWIKYFEQLKAFHEIHSDSVVAYEDKAEEKHEEEVEVVSEPNLQELHKLWRDEFQRLCAKYSVKMTSLSDAKKPLPNEKRNKTAPTKEITPKTTFDKIQMLPENINCRIFSYLNKDTLKMVKNVNPYWTFMTNVVTKERDISRKLNEIILKMEQSQMSLSSRGQSSDELSDLPQTPNPRGRKEVVFLLKLFNRDSHRIQLAPKPKVTALTKEFLDSRVTTCNPKGTLLAVSTSQWSVTFYSLVTGILLNNELVGHCDEITCMCFTSDGKHLITGSADTSARCWDVSEQSLLAMYTGHQHKVTAVSTYADYVITGGMDKLLKVFKILDGTCVATFLNEHPITCITINLKEDKFYCGHINGYISIFNFSGKKLILSIKAHTDSITVLFMKYPILVSGGSDGVVRLWNSRQPKSQCLIEIQHSSGVRGVCISEKYVFSGYLSGCVRAWNLVTSQNEQEVFLGGIPSPILDIHSKKKSNCIQVIVNAKNAVYSVELDLWDVKHKPVFGPPHKKCCETFMASGENQREPFGISPSAYQKIVLMKRCCVHKKLRDPLDKSDFYRSILSFVVSEVPTSFALPAVSLKPFKRLVNFKDTTVFFEEMYRRSFPLVTFE